MFVLYLNGNPPKQSLTCRSKILRVLKFHSFVLYKFLFLFLYFLYLILGKKKNHFSEILFLNPLVSTGIHRMLHRVTVREASRCTLLHHVFSFFRSRNREQLIKCTNTSTLSVDFLNTVIGVFVRILVSCAVPLLTVCVQYLKS